MLRKIFRNLLIFQTLLASLFFTSVLMAADPSAQKDTSVIKIGKTGSESGQDAPIGKNMTLGIQIYFDKINAKGGVDGHKLQLIAMDDGYAPLKAGENARKLINEDQVIALIG